MQPDARKLLEDVRRACDLLGEFTASKALADYEDDAMLRSAVERQFEIIGEAVNALTRIDLATAQRLTRYERIIAFRNILIHAYADVDNRLVWDVLLNSLPTLRNEVATLLTEPK